jgi:rhodanese-related sulfurtransferase
MINIHDSILALNQNIKSINGDIAYDADNNEVAYDKAAAEAYIAANAYKAQRAKEYPSFADQFDTIFHDGIDAWKAQIQAVKDKYPKGTE